MGYYAEIQVLGRERERSGKFVYGTFGAPFLTADGQNVMVIALTPQQWTDLIDITGTEAVIAAIESNLGVDFGDEHQRYKHRQLLYGLFAEWFAGHSTDQVLNAARQRRVLFSVLQSFEQSYKSDLVQQNTLFSNVNHPGIGVLAAAGLPAYFERAGRAPAPVAPLLGQDTEWVLGELLGLSASQITRLHDNGVVASANRS